MCRNGRMHRVLVVVEFESLDAFCVKAMRSTPRFSLCCCAVMWARDCNNIFWFQFLSPTCLVSQNRKIKYKMLYFCCCFSLAAWTLITRKCVATKAMYWTSSGIPSLKTSLHPALRTLRQVTHSLLVLMSVFIIYLTIITQGEVWFDDFEDTVFVKSQAC